MFILWVWCCINPTKIQNFRQSRSIVLIENNQRGDDARHPAAKREQKHDEHRTAAAVVHRQGREEDGKEDSEEGHGGFIFDYELHISSV